MAVVTADLNNYTKKVIDVRTSQLTQATAQADKISREIILVVVNKSEFSLWLFGNVLFHNLVKRNKLQSL